MTDVLVTLAKLPKVAYVPLNSDPCLVTRIRRGVSGYYPVMRHKTEAKAQAQCDRLNAQQGMTEKQLEAMQIGAMFGWEVPGADPDYLA